MTLEQFAVGGAIFAALICYLVVFLQEAWYQHRPRYLLRADGQLICANERDMQNLLKARKEGKIKSLERIE